MCVSFLWTLEGSCNISLAYDICDGLGITGKPTVSSLDARPCMISHNRPGSSNVITALHQRVCSNLHQITSSSPLQPYKPRWADMLHSGRGRYFWGPSLFVVGQMPLWLRKRNPFWLHLSWETRECLTAVLRWRHIRDFSPYKCSGLMSWLLTGLKAEARLSASLLGMRIGGSIVHR